MRVPIELNPTLKHSCLTLRLPQDWQLVLDWKAVLGVLPDADTRIGDLRQSILEAQKANLLVRKPAVFVPTTILVAESPHREENMVYAMDSVIWSVFSDAGHWPLFLRALISPHKLMNEINFATQFGEKFIRIARANLVNMGYSSNTTENEVHEIFLRFAAIDRDKIDEILDNPDHFEKLSGSLHSVAAEDFIRHRLRHHAPIGFDCPVCLEKFGNQAQQPVRFCSGGGPCSPHYLCRKCSGHHLNEQLKRRLLGCQSYT